MAGTPFGLTTPITSASVSSTPWGQSPYGIAGPNVQNINPFAFPQGQQTYSLQPTQLLYQLLQIVPQQLQALQQLDYLQHQQLQQLVQIVQVVPAQIAQLQQLVQLALQQTQQTQPFGQLAGAGGIAVAPPWGISPQFLGPQPAQVM